MTAPLLTLSQLRGIQAIGEQGMNVPVEILHKVAYAKDPLNPYGDEDVVWADPVTVMGWLVTKPTERIAVGAGQVQALATHTLRVPVGTDILSDDRVRIGDEEFVVTDATNEQSWPEWTVAYLRGYEPSGKG
jgi:hypothetical protein